ncbi:hypothetical protein FRB95_006449 [Tulasnella sp. JGI-2019a]|nr:hypothetical protein FRB95_006449 [Tulasnella sp. JGI-2019a]
MHRYAIAQIATYLSGDFIWPYTLIRRRRDAMVTHSRRPAQILTICGRTLENFVCREPQKAIVRLGHSSLLKSIPDRRGEFLRELPSIPCSRDTFAINFGGCRTIPLLFWAPLQTAPEKQGTSRRACHKGDTAFSLLLAPSPRILFPTSIALSAEFNRATASEIWNCDEGIQK